jgi:ferritin-like metal-binding protein YciE
MEAKTCVWRGLQGARHKSYGSIVVDGIHLEKVCIHSHGTEIFCPTHNPFTRSNMSANTLKELFIDELKDLYSAEKQIVRSLPKLARAATSEELRTALLEHLEETKGQVSRLEQIAQIVGKKPTGKSCVGMKGVLEEGSEVLEDTEKGEVRDAALIASCQRVEHYEMAGYGSARDFAKLLAMPEVVELLEETLAEEKAADKKLTEISRQVNRDAKQAA